MAYAIESLKMEATAKALTEARQPKEPGRLDPFSPAFRPDEKVVLGKDAENVADKPKLSGNAEWDAVELAETDAMREPFSNEFVEHFLKGSRGNRTA